MVSRYVKLHNARCGMLRCDVKCSVELWCEECGMKCAVNIV